MQAFLITLAVIVTLYCLVYLFLLFRLKNPFKNLIINAIIGIAALALIYIIRKFTGTYIPINQWTVLTSAVGGLPAVCGILITRILII